MHGYSNPTNLCMKFKLSELTPDSTPGHAWPTGVCIDIASLFQAGQTLFMHAITV